MTHAAPRSRGMIEQSRTTDVFDARAHRMARVVLPVLAGVVYGYWAAANRRYGGPITGSNLLLGILTGLVFTGALITLLTLAPRLRRGLHALVWAAFAGCAVGFLYSQSNPSIYRSVGVGVGLMVGTFVILFYRYYTKEDAEGNRPE
ncbi:hypothetical protein [Streptomyces sp. NPDC093991]|uniref:hypothetical protein n=1 Tax=unclassified Streptomyces TaxID=2593676 RepID=UPI0034163F53